ncbi:hypothetical protein B296_00040258, partial [Ensete ventricosum]
DAARCARQPPCQGAATLTVDAVAPIGDSPLQAGRWRSPLASAPEIVYPCIPDPDGEDEGGQASSSLAISTRWIFAMKLLQSDLVTLAQREGGE